MLLYELVAELVEIYTKGLGESFRLLLIGIADEVQGTHCPAVDNQFAETVHLHHGFACRCHVPLRHLHQRRTANAFVRLSVESDWYTSDYLGEGSIG